MNETMESIRVLGICKHLYLRYAYRHLARAMHAVNLHHTKTMRMDDGSVIHRCDWCGVERAELSSMRVQELRDMAAAEAT